MTRAVPVATGPLLAFLAGDWTLRRRLVDPLLGVEGHFEGTARFTPCEMAEASYREEGVITWQRHVGPAFRTLRCLAEGPERVVFAFPDGRPFHPLELHPEGYEAEHRCGADRYLGRFVLDGPDSWRAVWQVEGPRKRLLLEGTYRRRLRRD